MRYPAVLLDLDHTLLDSDSSEAAAFALALATAGVADPALYFPRYRILSRCHIHDLLPLSMSDRLHRNIYNVFEFLDNNFHLR